MESLYVWTIYCLHTVSAIYVWEQIFGYRYQGRHRKCFWIAISFLAAAASWLVRTLIPEASIWRFILTVGISWAYLILPFRGSLKKRVFLTAAETVMMLAFELAAYGILKAMGIHRQDYWYGSREYYGVTLYYMLFYIGIMLIAWAVYVRKRFSGKHFLCLTLPCYQILLVGVFLFSGIRQEEYVMLVGIVSICFDIFLDCVVVRILNRMIRRLDAEEKLTELYSQRQYELDYYRSGYLHMEEFRKIRHDFMNQIQTAYFLLHEENRDITRIRETGYREKERICQTMEACKRDNWCENPVLNAVLAIKWAEAQKKRISMEISCHVGKQCVLSETEICSLFGNLLDNAIEACEKVEEKKRRLSLTAEEREEQGLKIVCDNTFKAETAENGEIWLTRKKEKAVHGLGLKIMENICASHGAKIDRTICGDCVRVEIRF